MCIPSKFSNWHALIFEAVSIVTYIVCTWFVTCEDCEKQILHFALVVECCKGHKTSRDQCSTFNLIFFCIQFSFSFLCRNNSLLYDTDIQKECLIYVNILQKKVLNIYNFVSMFLSHKVRIVLLDNHFSFVKVMWNVKSKPLQLKMKISVGLIFLWASFPLVCLGLTFSNVSASNICRGQGSLLCPLKHRKLVIKQWKAR